MRSVFHYARFHPEIKPICNTIKTVQQSKIWSDDNDLSARKLVLKIFPPSQSFFFSGSSRQSQLWSFFRSIQVVLGAVPVQHTCCLRSSKGRLGAWRDPDISDMKWSWFDKVNVILGDFSRLIKTQNGAVENKKSSKHLEQHTELEFFLDTKSCFWAFVFYFSRVPWCHERSILPWACPTEMDHVCRAPVFHFSRLATQACLVSPSSWRCLFGTFSVVRFVYG